jgi:hypothetical protein
MHLSGDSKLYIDTSNCHGFECCNFEGAKIPASSVAIFNPLDASVLYIRDFNLSEFEKTERNMRSAI